MSERADGEALTWRRWFYVNLHSAAWPGKGLSPLNRIISALIIVAVAVAILESEPEMRSGREPLFRALEFTFASIFLVEYLLRLWIAAENPACGPGIVGRLKYAVTIPALIDLIALSTLFMAFLGSEGALLRLLRLSRIFMLARLGRYSTALQAIGHAVSSRRYELAMSLGIAFMLLLISSTVLYVVEGPHQPDHFGSIPRAMWWSIATLTTVGYGDVFPVTPLGKIFAGVTAITGIGLIAMPTGILASAFSDALKARRDEHGGEK
ncbi:MAG: ion transporter [Rhizobiaceae bacterium]